MKRTAFIFFMCIGLVACLSTKPIHLADGSKGFKINCSGQLYSKSDCYEQAGKACGPKGYVILEENTERSTYESQSVNANVVANNIFAQGNLDAAQSSGEIIDRYMLIKCKR